jgi:hypothetical protein
MIWGAICTPKALLLESSALVILPYLQPHALIEFQRGKFSSKYIAKHHVV